MRLRLITQNLKHSGILNSSGGRDDRWDSPAKVIRRLRAHVDPAAVTVGNA